MWNQCTLDPIIVCDRNNCKFCGIANMKHTMTEKKKKRKRKSLKR